MAVIIRHHGDFRNLEKFLKGYDRQKLINVLAAMGQEGVNALASATPVDSGITAGSWDFEIKVNKNSFSIVWTNSHINQGIPIAILIQYGHGTGTGGYVQGRDFINPAIKPIFDKLAQATWEEVAKL